MIGEPLIIDEPWLETWILYGMSEFDDFLNDHARFDAYLFTTRGEHEHDPA